MNCAEAFQKILLGVIVSFSSAGAAMVDGERFSIENNSDTALFHDDMIRSVDYIQANPLSIIYLDSIKYLYAVVRDRYGNFVRLADSSAAWTSLSPDTVGVISKTVKDAHGVAEITARPGVASGRALIVVSDANVVPDTVVVEIRGRPHDEFLRLVDIEHPDSALDTIRLDTDQSMTVKVQRISTLYPDWVDAAGYWSVSQGTLQAAIPVPSTQAGAWQIDPTAAGSAILTVTSGTVSVSVPVIFRADSGAYRLTATLLTSLDSCFPGRPIKILSVLENLAGPVPGTHDVSLQLHDILDNSRATPLPYFIFNGRNVVDSLDQPANVTITDGIDTLELFLFYVTPSSDSLHQLQLTVIPNAYGALTAKTIPFRLRNDPAGIRLPESFFSSDRHSIAVKRSPESGTLRISFNANSPCNISVCSITGKSICSFAAGRHETALRLPPGIYLLQVRDLATRAEHRRKLLVQ